MKNHLRPDDYNVRLHHTVVMYKGFPVMVTVDGTDQFTLSPVWNGSKFQPLRVHPDDPNLDISTCPLGYFINRNGDYTVAYHIERLTPRKWQQGINSNNTSVTVVDKNRHTPTVRGGAYFNCEGFEQLVMNNFPSLEEIFRRLKSPEVQSLAVNKDVAISKNDGIYIVFFKKDEVGWMKPGRATVKLPAEANSWIVAKHLRELNWEIE